jgi:hypothetical protein
MEELESVRDLTDDELVLRVRHCVREDRRVSALLLAHLGEIEARGLHRDLGYESMFEYAVRALHMSDSEAGLRLHAARFARKFPAALKMLSRGELHLTALKLLAPVLTAENAELLNMACLKTKQEIQLLIAKHCPQPDAPAVIRRLPSARSVNASATSLDLPISASAAAHIRQQLPGETTSRPASSIAADATPAGVSVGLFPHELHRPASATPTEVVSSGLGHKTRNTELPRPVAAAPHAGNREPALPISEGRYKFEFSAGQRVRDLLQEAQDLYRSQLPNGDIEVLVERALVLLVAERKKQLFAQTDKPRRSSAEGASTSKPHSRHIASATKRRVYLRDEGRCRFVSPTGERCCARSRLEFHHVRAFGRGGPSTEENIVLFCRAHNALLAERDYSREHIQHCIRTSRAAATQDTTAKPSDRSKPKAAPAGAPPLSTCSNRVRRSTDQHGPEFLIRASATRVSTSHARENPSENMLSIGQNGSAGRSRIDDAGLLRLVDDV